MAQHRAKSEYTLRVRTALGGALAAGALLTAPVVVPAITGVASAQPTPPSDPGTPSPGGLNDLNKVVSALKSAYADHNTRVTAAQSKIRAGVLALNSSQVQSGWGDINKSGQQLRVQVQGILRGSLAPKPK